MQGLGWADVEAGRRLLYAGWPSTGRGVISILGPFALSEALVSGLSSGSLFDPSEPSMSERMASIKAAAASWRKA